MLNIRSWHGETHGPCVLDWRTMPHSVSRSERYTDKRHGRVQHDKKRVWISRMTHAHDTRRVSQACQILHETFHIIMWLFIFPTASSEIVHEMNKDFVLSDALNMVKTFNLPRKALEHHDSSEYVTWSYKRRQLRNPENNRVEGINPRELRSIE